MIYQYVPYSEYIRRNFRFAEHRCTNTCSCAASGCTHHWYWINSEPPDTEDMRYQLATWQAFRNKVDAQDRFILGYDKIAKLVMPLMETSIVCDWQDEIVTRVFDEVRDILGGSVVLTTKTLHFFLPDLFIILDRAQVFPKWKREMRTIYSNPLGGPIDDVHGGKYITLLRYARQKLHFRTKSGEAIVLGGNSTKPLDTVQELRFASPLSKQELPNTFTKALDNLIRGSQLEP